MKLVKTSMVFVLGLVAGGLIFGLYGPINSQAEGVPGDILTLNDSSYYMDQTKFMQIYYVDKKYKVEKVESMLGGRAIHMIFVEQ